MATPNWSAGQAGILGTASAYAASAQVNQLLGTHLTDTVYQGTQILTPDGTGASPYALQTSTTDIDQPFTMSGTVVGRVVLPLLPVGNGADLLVSLCSDSSGSPGTMITQTRIPASWIYQLSSIAAIGGPSSEAPLIETTGNPLAVAANNAFLIGPAVSVPWPTPAASGASNTILPAVAASGNYLVIAGGIRESDSALQSAVYSIAWNGATGLSPAIVQPSMPAAQTYGGLAITTDTIAYIAGGEGTFVTDVYTASWNSSTGTVGAWSSQAAFPYLTDCGGVATNGETIYVVGAGFGGDDNAAGNTVTWTTVSNGQITAWNVGTALPNQLSQVNLGVVGGFLVVAGGVNGNTGPVTTTYYAVINSDGSVGKWLPGPTLPDVSYDGNSALQIAVTPSGILVAGKGGDNEVFALAFDENGPSAWTSQLSANINSGSGWAAFATGAGQWQMFSMLHGGTSNTYYTTTLFQQPMISVPLPATGLTNGATYHVLIQQQGGDSNNYVRVTTDVDVFSGNPTALTSPRLGYTWTAQTSGTAVPLAVFNQTVVGNKPLHTWEDGGLRVSTLIYATTPDQRLLGLAEATALAYASNANQGFEFGITPWTLDNGTVVRSNAEVFEGNYSALVTPPNSVARVHLTSEMMPCLPGQSVAAACQAWCATAEANGFGVFINWYTAGGSLISTVGSYTALGASTWTPFTETATAPATAYLWQISISLQGSIPIPAFYVDNAYGYVTTGGPQVSSVVQVPYPGTWPGGTYPPTGLVELG